ncbi:hypothetical protein C8R46DRAFT_883048 [Mycena filopes]|nr:hypothetical protein C8R46DRAFT_883048 [Mycena filopes]
MEPAPPPSYSADSPAVDFKAGAKAEAKATSDAPPAYSFPEKFSIGNGRTTEPFVNASQLKDHLALLHAFAELKLSVEAMGPDSGIPHLPTDKEHRWAFFVGLAVERFEKWCRVLEPSHSEKGIATILPPIDVIMVWHAYLLNPGWYAEDGERIEALKGLLQAGEAFSTALASELGQILAAEPSGRRVDNWKQMTATEFDHVKAASEAGTRAIACPKCRSVVHTPYMNEEATGYLQHNFTIECTKEGCNFDITRDTLALRKLAVDLARTGTGGKEPGTIHTSTNVRDLTRGRIVKGTMLLPAVLKRPAGKEPGMLISDKDYAVQVMEVAKYKLDRLRALLAMRMKAQGGNLMARIMSAYVDDKMFSVELVGAVLRQGSFVTKMYDLQWTQPGFFDSAEDEVALQHSIARYHAFLDLMSSSPVSFFVPTLDIDLAWHTHQLMASYYARDTVTFVGRFVDHDDKVEESHLASSFDITCRAWKNRFGVQYTHCGCPLPGQTIGQRLSRLVGQSGHAHPSHLVPPNRAALLAATHPSDHNAVFAFHHKAASEAAQRRRREKIAKRAERERKDGTARAAGGVHDPAFLIPVPLYYSPMFLGTGNIVNGGTGYGACAAVGTLFFSVDFGPDFLTGRGCMWGWRCCLWIEWVLFLLSPTLLDGADDVRLAAGCGGGGAGGGGCKLSCFCVRTLSRFMANAPLSRRRRRWRLWRWRGMYVPCLLSSLTLCSRTTYRWWWWWMRGRWKLNSNSSSPSILQ